MLVIRTVATPAVGSGHAMRCLNFADAWARVGSGPVVLAGTITIPFVRERARALGVALVLEGSCPGGDILLVDTYDERARRSGAVDGSFVLRVLVDDLGETIPPGYDVVWNPNAYADRSSYPGFQGAVMAGVDVVPVRPDLPSWEGQHATAVGIALGGGRLPVVLRDALERLAERLAGWELAGLGASLPEGWHQLSQSGPWAELARCNRLAIGGGVTMWEAACVGVPVVVVQSAENQRRSVEWAAAHDVPTMDLRQAQNAEELADELAAGLHVARPLPRIQPGVERAARVLVGLSGTRRSARS
jgi:UDP-2,4-diacetamido-2,4,6-trideoxy-beta-L-altropyranose hydrolase